jgi:hypothetical protein
MPGHLGYLLHLHLLCLELPKNEVYTGDSRDRTRTMRHVAQIGMSLMFMKGGPCNSRRQGQSWRIGVVRQPSLNM